MQGAPVPARARAAAGKGSAVQRENLHRLYERQARWFAGERNRLLRKADIATRRSILDLGAGTGALLSELSRRAPGLTLGLDKDVTALRMASGCRVAGHAARLPFRDGAFDLVVTQMFFLWATPLEAIIREVRRVLSSRGVLIAAAEPDYGGAIEHPAGNLARLAEQLSQEGADVAIARKLGGELGRAGFSVECGIHPARPLEAAQPDSVYAAPELVKAPAGQEFLFLPYFHFLARKG